MQLPGLTSSPEVELYLVAEDPGQFAAVTHEIDRDYGEGRWRALDTEQMRKAIEAGLPESTEVVLIGVASDDAARLDEIAAVIAGVKRAHLPVVLLVRDLGPGVMHRLLRTGADDFLPYPPEDGQFAECLGQVRATARGGRDPARRAGAILAVYGVAGGVGATTFAVNLAWELALELRKPGLTVALLDLDVQYGAVSTYLDLRRRETVFELLSDLRMADPGSYEQALQSYGRHMPVLTAPADSAPVDILGPEEAGRLLDLASGQADIVVCDLPTVVTPWTETVMRKAEVFYTLMESDMRNANNLLRFLRALRAEEMPVEKVAYVMNRAPGFTDLSGKARIARMAETLGIEYALTLPDGGRTVSEACDQGKPLAEYASGNALRKEIRRAAQSLAKTAMARAESA